MRARRSLRRCGMDPWLIRARRSLRNYDGMDPRFMRARRSLRSYDGMDPRFMRARRSLRSYCGIVRCARAPERTVVVGWRRDGMGDQAWSIRGMWFGWLLWLAPPHQVGGCRGHDDGAARPLTRGQSGVARRDSAHAPRSPAVGMTLSYRQPLNQRRLSGSRFPVNSAPSPVQAGRSAKAA